MIYEARAFLDVPGETAVAGFQQAAKSAGLPHRIEDGALLLTLQRGTIRVAAEGGQTAVHIDAREAVGLQLLRDLLAEKVAAMGVGIDWQTRTGVTRPSNLSIAAIETVVRISPSYMRATLVGPDLARFASGGLHFRILLGPEGAPWPSTDAGGVTQWPGGSESWHRPVYTTRAIAPLPGGAARITLDVFLHDGGRVTDWITAARPGDEIAITGPGGTDLPSAAWLGIVADETAVPVAARMLANVAAGTRGMAVLFVPSAEDVQDLAHPAGVSVRWVLRGGAETPTDALAGLTPPATDRYIFFAAERAEAVRARASLAERGFGRGEFHAAAYWTAP